MLKGSSSSILAEILHPLPVDRFLSETWPEHFLVQHAGLERLKRFAEIPELFDLDHLARVYEGDVQLWIPKVPGNERLFEEFHLKVMGASEALRYYEMGATLYFGGLEGHHAAVRKLNRQMQRDLELSSRSTKVDFFASKAGYGTPPHFDFDLNFNVQLRGRKTWTVAPNTQIPHPLTDYRPMEGPPKGEMRLYAPETVENRIPDPSRTFETGPGSLVFMPHGHWHSTKAIDDSLAIAMIIAPPPWLELVLLAVRRRLIVDPRWRKRVLTADLGCGQWDGTRQLIRGLSTALKDLDLEEVFRARAYRNANETLFEPNREYRISVVPGCFRIEGPRGETRRIDMAEDTEALVRWIAGRKEAFLLSEAVLYGGDIEADRIHAILDTLAAEHALTELS